MNRRILNAQGACNIQCLKLIKHNVNLNLSVSNLKYKKSYQNLLRYNHLHHLSSSVWLIPLAAFTVISLLHPLLSNLIVGMAYKGGGEL